MHGVKSTAARRCGALRAAIVRARGTAIALALAGGPAGCIAGNVSDAVSGSGLDGVSVYADGKCSGNACVSANEGHETTKSGGQFVFDAYGNWNGAADVQQVLGSYSSGALILGFSKPGYQPLLLMHKPNYATYTDDQTGQTYDYSQLHYNVYLCPIGAPDSDGDGLCDAAEARYGTDPQLVDSDGDGFSDASEILGLDGVDMYALGANPLHRDLFVYINYYQAPIQAGLDQVVAAFANAPLTNPDGTTGITLHLIMGGQIAAADQNQNIVGPLAGNWSQLDTIKNKYLPYYLAPIVHYGLFAYRYDGAGSSGIARGIPAHDFMVTLGGWSPSYGSQQQQAGTFMHELGHTLGLQHGGNEGTNYKPNYISVMSYTYQLVGIDRDGVDGTLDYSRLSLAGVAENALNELQGILPVAPTTHAELLRVQPRFAKGLVKGTLGGPLDFNGNGVYDSGIEQVDLDGDKAISSAAWQPSQNDWSALVYTGAAYGGGIIGAGRLVAASALMAGPTGQTTLVAPLYQLPATVQTVLPENMPRELTQP